MQFFGGSEISPSPPAPTASGNNAHMIYVFNRNGVCLLYREWNRPLHTLNAQQDHKLMFGLLFSLKSLTAKMDPTKYIYIYIYFVYCNSWNPWLKWIIMHLNLYIAKWEWEKRSILTHRRLFGVWWYIQMNEIFLWWKVWMRFYFIITD